MDRISDFLTIIRNANNAHKETCSAPYSKINRHIAEIMKNEGLFSYQGSYLAAKPHATF